MALWFPFCCDPGDCQSCDPDPGDTVALMLAGWTDGYCDCGWLNSTFILQRSPLAACYWSHVSEQDCGSYYGPTILQIGIVAQIITLPGGNLGWEVSVTVGYVDHTITLYYLWDSGDTIPFDCSATVEPTLILASANAEPYPCENYEAITCQIN